MGQTFLSVFCSLVSCYLTLSLDGPCLAFLLFLQNRDPEGAPQEHEQSSHGLGCSGSWEWSEQGMERC